MGSGREEFQDGGAGVGRDACSGRIHEGGMDMFFPVTWVPPR